MARNECAVESTFFIPKSGLDAANYLVIASKIKIAAHKDVQAEDLHFLDDLRQIIILHKRSLRREFTADGFLRKSTSPVVLVCMDGLLARLRDVGLRLCFRMWSRANAQELVGLALAECEAIDNDGFSDEAQRDSDTSGYGAVVGFLIVQHSLPLEIADSCNGHAEICLSQVPDWESLHDELAEV